MDNFLTIEAKVNAMYKEKGSKFIACAYPFESEASLEHILNQVKSEYPKASHYCFAYNIGMHQDRWRANDDGEPSGSAGKPILGQIYSFGLTNLLIIVVRYYGGTKLGVSGLINAYKTATRNALSEAVIVEKYNYVLYQLTFPYASMGQVMHVVKEMALDIWEKEFASNCMVVLKMRQSTVDKTILLIKAGLLLKSVEEVDDDTLVPFCTFKRMV